MMVISTLTKETTVKNRIATLALAAGLLGGNAAAHATTFNIDLECSGFKQTLGDAGHNPPVSARVLLNSAGWTVRYTLANGDNVDRSKQYAMHDQTSASLTGWTGWGIDGKRADLGMVGRILRRNADGHALYTENLYDRSNKLLASNEIDCGFVPEQRPVVADAFVPQPAPKDPPAPLAPPPPLAPAAPVAPQSKWLVDRCFANAVEWELAFDEEHGVAEFIEAANAKPEATKRYGQYRATHDAVDLTVGSDQMKLHMASDLSLSWELNATQGTMQCMKGSDDKPTWWTDPAPAPQPPVAQGSAHDSMPITLVGTKVIAPVILGGSLAVDMMIDTGCTDLAITQSIADQLLASGQATYGEDVEYTLADGSKHINKTLNIETVSIGGHVLHNVHAGIGEEGGMLLLGFTVLQQISPKFSIDSAAGVLTFG